MSAKIDTINTNIYKSIQDKYGYEGAKCYHKDDARN